MPLRKEEVLTYYPAPNLLLDVSVCRYTLSFAKLRGGTRRVISAVMPLLIEIEIDFWCD